MIGDAVLGVDDENDDVGVLDGLQGLDDGELLDGPRTPCPSWRRAGRVDELVGTAVVFEVDADGVAGGAGHVEGDEALFADQAL